MDNSERTIFGRPYYVRQLEHWRDHDLVKVVTGVRRCG